MLSPFEWWCRNFILPDICKPCLFVFLRNLFYLTKFKETMEAFQQKRAEFIAQEIRIFDAETLYVFLEWIRGNGHKLDRITGMAV